MKKTIILEFVFVIGLTVCVYGVFGAYHIHFENCMFSPPRPVVNTSKAAGHYTMEDLLDAIEQVESGGDANAIGDNGNAVGSYQIWKIYVDDVNRINRIGYTDKYSDPIQYDYNDRKSKYLSRYMVKTYLTHYGGTVEEMARKHNGGPTGHKKEATVKYWLKVKAEMENVK